MIVFKSAVSLYSYLADKKENGKKIGFVPTMGALHQGHISLINECKKENDFTVCSIFVNPTQFNDPADFEKYPVTIDKDIQMLELAGCEVLFLPTVIEIYPLGIRNEIKYELDFLETVLEGKFRPGHFQGVCQVVHRLLDIVEPNNFYLGQKDFQQCMVIKKLLELTGKSQIIHLTICPTMREPDGLAMSSRNLRLNKEERAKAKTISAVLNYIIQNIKPGEISDIITKAGEQLLSKGFKIDYLEIADSVTLQPVQIWDGKQKIVVLVAAFLNDVRLIDNMIINP